MKNRDGIEIKVGQVWKTPGSEREVIAFRNGYIITWNERSCTCISYPPNSSAFTTIISDPDQPWLPLPEGYKLKDHWEEGELVPDTAMFFFPDLKIWRKSSQIGKTPANVTGGKYAVLDYEFVKPWPPLPAGYKLKEYWEEGELVPEGAMYWNFMKKEWRRSNVIGQCPCDKDKYAVPVDYEFVKPTQNMTPAIEVDWNSIQGDTIEFDKLILQRPGTTPPVDEKPFKWEDAKGGNLANAIKQLQEEVQKLKEQK